VGPTRATLITFVNPAVAVVLGAIVLGERITLATLGGFVLVLGGCYLATSIGPSSRVARDQSEPSSVGSRSAAAANAVARPADFS
jgi:threonine/homoserine efflux transporter RhtA